ncbi:MAG: 5'-nucleotidase C-terminal domain-containing protein [Flavobacteriaceae bacterium]
MKKLLTLLFVTILFVSCNKEPYQVSKITAKTNLIDPTIRQDSTIINEYLPYKDKMIKEITRKLSYAPENIVRTDGVLQSSLGNLIADLSYEKANTLFEKETGKKVDFSMSNYGGIRAGIMKGKVTVSNAFELMPFDNTIVVVELTAEKVEELFEYFAVKNVANPLSKQVQIKINRGEYDITINGKPIDMNRTYFVATSDYLQKGGDGMNFFVEPESLYKSNFLIRDAIAEYFQSKDTLVASTDKRVMVIR